VLVPVGVMTVTLDANVSGPASCVLPGQRVVRGAV